MRSRITSILVSTAIADQTGSGSYQDFHIDLDFADSCSIAEHCEHVVMGMGGISMLKKCIEQTESNCSIQVKLSVDGGVRDYCSYESTQGYTAMYENPFMVFYQTVGYDGVTTGSVDIEFTSEITSHISGAGGPEVSEVSEDNLCQAPDEFTVLDNPSISSNILSIDNAEVLPLTYNSYIRSLDNPIKSITFSSLTYIFTAQGSSAHSITALGSLFIFLIDW